MFSISIYLDSQQLAEIDEPYLIFQTNVGWAKRSTHADEFFPLYMANTDIFICNFLCKNFLTQSMISAYFKLLVDYISFDMEH